MTAWQECREKTRHTGRKVMNVEYAMVMEILEHEITGKDGFMWKLASGQGIDAAGYERMVDALKELVRLWTPRTEVPKSAAGLIFWLDKGMETASFGYDDSTGNLIREKAMEIHILLEHVFNSTDC